MKRDTIDCHCNFLMNQHRYKDPAALSLSFQTGETSSMDLIDNWDGAGGVGSVTDTLGSRESFVIIVTNVPPRSRQNGVFLFKILVKKLKKLGTPVSADTVKGR